MGQLGKITSLAFTWVAERYNVVPPSYQVELEIVMRHVLPNLLFLSCAFVATAESAVGQVLIRRCYRQGGTYVQAQPPHFSRGNAWNNWNAMGGLTGQPTGASNPRLSSTAESFNGRDSMGSWGDSERNREQRVNEAERRREEANRKREERVKNLAEASARQLAEHTFRTWTDDSGTYSVTAKFSGLTRNTVTLLREDGEVVRVDRQRLSVNDNDYIDSAGRRGRL